MPFVPSYHHLLPGQGRNTDLASSVYSCPHLSPCSPVARVILVKDRQITLLLCPKPSQSFPYLACYSSSHVKGSTRSYRPGPFITSSVTSSLVSLSFPHGTPGTVGPSLFLKYARSYIHCSSTWNVLSWDGLMPPLSPLAGLTQVSPQ